MTILNPNPQNTKYKRDKKDNFGSTKQKLSEIEKWETAILTVRRKGRLDDQGMSRCTMPREVGVKWSSQRVYTFAFN